jgi:DNA-binding response OmpR family regulator
MNEQGRVLVVDDEPDICTVVEFALSDAGYEVYTHGRGDGVVDIVQEKKIDLVVLDLGLPGVDGLTLTRTLKERMDVGVIIVSGRGESTEKVIGLEIGADDYMAKPFEPRELLARVRSVLRRVEKVNDGQNNDTSSYLFDGWKLDIMVRNVISPSGEQINMSSGEFNLLRAFVEHPNRVLSRDMLLDFTHDVDAPAFDRSVDVQIARLRKKIEPDPQSPAFIKTVRNAGYIFSAKVTPG